MGRWPAAGGHPAAGGGGSREIRALSPAGGGRGGPAGGAIHPAGCLGGGDGRRAAGFCQPVGFAPVSGEPDLPADAARRGGGGDRGLSASKAPAGPVGADVRAAAAEDAGGLRAGPGPGPGGLFPGCQAAPGPLLRREVAVQLGVHPSTVTRALRHKYLQCRQGLFPMEYFFARPMGAEGASPQRAKAALARMIQGRTPGGR